VFQGIAGGEAVLIFATPEHHEKITGAMAALGADGLVEIVTRASGDKAVLVVRDNGAGIEPGLLPKIFDLFAQGKQAIDRGQGGLGLGLTIARNITEMHGGRLYGKSEGSGKGAEFVLELPLLAQPVSTAKTSAEQTAQTMIPDRKILVVDDNADAADSLSEALQMLGHLVQVAYDGPSALRVAQTFQPDLALLDIGLPAMDGYELGQQLRASSSNTLLKLVALTGYGQETDRRRTADAGFDRHLVKPVDFDRLQAVIEELFPKA
jgi:CheY-like chemotaxis protein